MLTEAKRIANHDRVVELLNTVARDGISELLKWLEESDFFTAPASHAYHGSYIGGLCEHSLNVYDETKRLLAAYPEINVSEDTVIVSALLHDLCKVNFYTTEKRNRKNSETNQWESYDAFAIREKFCYGQSLVKYMSTQNVDEMVSKDMPDKVLTNFLDEFTITE